MELAEFVCPESRILGVPSLKQSRERGGVCCFRQALSVGVSWSKKPVDLAEYVLPYHQRVEKSEADLVPGNKKVVQILAG